jgi:hypothetical protein
MMDAPNLSPSSVRNRAASSSRKPTDLSPQIAIREVSEPGKQKKQATAFCRATDQALELPRRCLLDDFSALGGAFEVTFGANLRPIAS